MADRLDQLGRVGFLIGSVVDVSEVKKFKLHFVALRRLQTIP